MTDLYKRLCTENFKEFLVGCLWEGVLHNINSPLQVISMNLELLKMKKDSYPSISSTSFWERIEQIGDSVGRIQSIANVLTKRKEFRGGESTAIILEELFKNELEFWNSDLFFKHNIKKHLINGKTSHVVIIEAPILIDLIDSALAIQIAMLKVAKGQELILTLQISEDQSKDSVIVLFDRTGPPFPPEKEYLDPSDAPDPFFFELCSHVLQSSAKRLGCTLSIEGTTITVEIPKAPRP